MHTQISSKASALDFDSNLHQRPFFVFANSAGSVETAYMCRLIWTVKARRYDIYQNHMLAQIKLPVEPSDQSLYEITWREWFVST